MSILDLLDEIPPEAVGPVVALVKGLFGVIRADSKESRLAAMMKTVEDLKAEHDRIKFGGGGG